MDYLVQEEFSTGNQEISIALSFLALAAFNQHKDFGKLLVASRLFGPNYFDGLISYYKSLVDNYPEQDQYLSLEEYLNIPVKYALKMDLSDFLVENYESFSNEQLLKLFDYMYS